MDITCLWAGMKCDNVSILFAIFLKEIVKLSSNVIKNGRDCKLKSRQLTEKKKTWKQLQVTTLV